MYVELYLLSNVVLLHVEDTNPTTYVCDILILHKCRVIGCIFTCNV